MAVMTWATFEGRTGKMGAALRARGKNLAKVDGALKKYWKKQGAAGGDAKAALLSSIVSECEKWLKTKAVGTGNGSELFQRRRWAIKDLAKSALDELLVLKPNLLADVAFSARKVETLGSGSATGKALEAGYSHERTDYMNKGKKALPISGSQVHGGHRNLASIAPRETGLQRKTFESLTFADFQKISRLGANDGFGGSVDFLTKDERKAFIAIPQGGLFVDGGGNNVDSPNPPQPGNRFPYAMDVYGNFFTKNEASTKQAAGNFNHSSFNAGKSVTCAGMTVILNGRLLWLDNSSGHYKPGRKELHALVTVLAQEGIDLGRAGVGLYEYPGGKMRVSLIKATNFLIDINYPAPRPLADDNEVADVLIDLANNALW